MRGTGTVCTLVAEPRGVKIRFSFAFIAIECATMNIYVFFNTLKTEIPSDIFLLSRTRMYYIIRTGVLF